MKAAGSRKASFFAIIMTLSLALTSASSKLGKQAPEWISRMFSPDANTMSIPMLNVLLPNTRKEELPPKP